MASDDPDETPWTRQLLVGAGVLVVVALLIGGVVSVVALGAVKVTGIDDSRPTATAKPSLYMPSGDPTVGLDNLPDPEGAPGGDPSARPSDAASAGPSKKRPISLQAFPQRVAANARISLTGVYRGGEGTRLQVQRFEKGWSDFPVSASVSGGQFATYVTTGRSGVNRFRVLDTGSGKASNLVRVTVG